jgi:hypothetical protein
VTRATQILTAQLESLGQRRPSTMCIVSPTIHHDSKQAPRCAKRAKHTTPKEVERSPPDRGEKRTGCHSLVRHPQPTCDQPCKQGKERQPVTQFGMHSSVAVLPARPRRDSRPTLLNQSPLQPHRINHNPPKRTAANTCQPKPAPTSSPRPLAPEETHDPDAPARTNPPDIALAMTSLCCPLAPEETHDPHRSTRARSNLTAPTTTPRRDSQPTRVSQNPPHPVAPSARPRRESRPTHQEGTSDHPRKTRPQPPKEMQPDPTESDKSAARDHTPNHLDSPKATLAPAV